MKHSQQLRDFAEKIGTELIHTPEIVFILHKMANEFHKDEQLLIDTSGIPDRVKELGIRHLSSEMAG